MVTIHEFWVIFRELPFKLKMGLVGPILMFLPSLNILLIFPIVFNYSIIPKIEKRVGTKIKWPSLIYLYPFGGFFMPSGLTAKSIFRAYLRYKFRGYTGEARGVLGNMGYSVKVMTKFELSMSLLVFFNCLLIIIGCVFTLIF
jgi:hypothetical protein